MAGIAIDLITQTLVRDLQKAEEFYVLISAFTREPYAKCDDVTFDDEALIFLDIEEAKAAAAEMAQEGEKLNLAKVLGKEALIFYSGLFSNGFNAIKVKHGDKERILQLDSFVKKKDPSEMEGKVWIENPELNITMIYYIQKLRKNPDSVGEEEMQELQQEMTAHFQEGKYIAAVNAENPKTGPLVKLQNGDIFQPLFTDAMQFARFNKDNKFKAVVIEATKLTEVLPKEVVGVVINPTGINMPLAIRRKAPQE